MSGSVAGAEMRTFFAPAARCCRLDYDVNAPIAPGQRGRISLRENLKSLAVDFDLTRGGLDLRVEHAVCGVVLEHMGENIRVGEIVDRNDLEARILLQVCPVEVPSDPAEAVDPNPCRHVPPVSASPASLTAPFRGMCRSAASPK
jgi:hypothetical protein